MQKFLFLLVSVCLFACGSASKASAPKTTNPPLTKPKTDTEPAKAADKPLEADGLTIKVNALGFSFTLPDTSWKGEAGIKDKTFAAQMNSGTTTIVMRAGIWPGQSAKDFAEGGRAAGTSNNPKDVVGPVTDMGNGRWCFTIETTAGDGSKAVGAFCAQDVKGVEDLVVSAMYLDDQAKAAASRKTFDALLDSVKALSK